MRRGASISYPAFGHDLGNPLCVAGAQIASALEDFDDIFLIGQPDQRGTLGAELGDIERRVEGLLLRLRPLEIAANAVFAPGRGVSIVIIKRRAAVGKERGGHEGSVGLDGQGVQ